MRIRIYSKSAKEITFFEGKSCFEMISSGAIYSLYEECLKSKKIRHRIFIAKSNKKFIGWAIINREKNKDWQFMVYVKRPYRRNGIGTKLYTKSKRYFKLKNKQISVYRTTNVNTKFFNKVKKEKVP